MGSWTCPNPKCVHDKEMHAGKRCPLCGAEAREFDFVALGNLFKEKWSITKSKTGTSLSERAHAHIGERVLAILEVRRVVFSLHPLVDEFLFLTSDRVIVARLPEITPLGTGYTSGGVSDIAWGIVELIAHQQEKKERREAEEHQKTLNPDEILKADKHNFAIPDSEITKVELKRVGARIDLNIITNTKKYKWMTLGIPEKKDVKFEDYESILRPVFRDKLFAKK